MKTLKRNGEFKRVKNSSTEDIRNIDKLLNYGWEFCPKSEWKDTKLKVEKVEPKKSTKKRGKN